MGGKPSRGTSKDRRLKSNRTGSSKVARVKSALRRKAK